MNEQSKSDSPQDDFVFFAFREEFLRQHDLPQQPCPVRMSVLEESLANDSLTVTKLADECILYTRQQADRKGEISTLLERLCHAAGIIVGRAGDDQRAREYFTIAHDCDPLNYQIATDYALSLSNTGDMAAAAAIFEKFISCSLADWQYLIPHAWTEAIKLHYWQKNYHRVMELVEILLAKKLEPSQFSRDNLIAIADDIRKKI
ncbi:MAG: hypothetical protein C4575_06715 [Desulforudis sp.]|jgi:tetratricopeptide (TPR) repeat protein|nr:MAG: hypothetical protein C4575_06715 [Desulforudis sp.]